MPWNWCWTNSKLMLCWYIRKLTLQENWPMEPFCFVVILKVISCWFTCQKMVPFDWIAFFLLNFKKHFSCFQQDHTGSDIPLETSHKNPNILSCVDILLQKIVIFEIYIKFCIFWVQNNACYTNIYYINAFIMCLKKLQINTFPVYDFHNFCL